MLNKNFILILISSLAILIGIGIIVIHYNTPVKYTDRCDFDLDGQVDETEFELCDEVREFL